MFLNLSYWYLLQIIASHGTCMVTWNLLPVLDNNDYVKKK